MSETLYDGREWEKVSNTGNQDYFDLAFINIDKETEEVTKTVNNEDIKVDDPEFKGVYKGVNDISSNDNNKVSNKHLVRNEEEEFTYAFNESTILNEQLKQVEEDSLVKVVFEGVEFSEDSGMPYYVYSVYTA